MNKLLTIIFFVLQSGYALSTEISDTDLPENIDDVIHWYSGWFKDDMRYKEIQTNRYRLTCFIPSSTEQGCRKQAEQVCEENGHPTKEVFNGRSKCVSGPQDKNGIEYSGCFHQWDIRCGGPISTVVGEDEDGNGIVKILPIPKPVPIRKRYEQVKYRYILKCGHYQLAADCRKKATDICENNNFNFEKMEVYGHVCADGFGETSKGYISCISDFKIHCTGREELPRRPIDD